MASPRKPKPKTPTQTSKASSRSAASAGYRQVALLRGINVGKAKRVAMADLRQLFETLGYRDVKTLLNSGNVVYSADSDRPVEAAARIEKGIASRIGFTSIVTVLTAGEVATVIAENSLTKVAGDPARLLVAFHMDRKALAGLRPLMKEKWAPEALAVGSHAAYLWCCDGILESRLGESVNRMLGPGVTTRNWATTQKLHAMLQEGAS